MCSRDASCRLFAGDDAAHKNRLTDVEFQLLARCSFEEPNSDAPSLLIAALKVGDLLS